MNAKNSSRPRSSDVSRRTMLRVTGAGAVGYGLLSAAPASASATSTVPLARPGDKGFWRSVERQFVIDPDVLFMNVGTVGSQPRSVLTALDQEYRRVARETVSGYSSFDDLRAVMAKGFGCDLDEIAVTHNTSDGMAKALMGLEWKSGDEILTTNHEHSGGIGPMSVLRDRVGVVIKEVALPVGNDQRAEDYVELFRKGITSSTKLIMFSAPTYKTGTMLPIALLSALAREHGIPTLVDGAHIPGMLDYRWRELGIDFLAGSMAKWQCGPGGTGVLYVRNKKTKWNSTDLPTFWPVISSSYPRDGLGPRTWGTTSEYDIGRYLTSVGNGPLAQVAGLHEVCNLWDRIGRRRIHDYVNGLSQYCKELVAERFGVDRLYSPKDDARLRCALTGFNPFVTATDVMSKDKSDAFVERVKAEHGITIRNVDFPVVGAPAVHVGVRISTHLFHDRQDVERVVDACWKVSRAMG